MTETPTNPPLININWETLGGAVVFTGTRVLLREVLDAAKAGAGLPQLQLTWPFLTKDHLAAATGFAQAYPDMLERPIREGAKS